MPEELWKEVHDSVQEAGIKTILKKEKGKKANWLSEEAIQIAENRREDGDCSHEIKRCLLLGIKAMTNLNSIFKNRDISLPTKVHLVKVMVFPVVMYECESWTIKEVEC